MSSPQVTFVSSLHDCLSYTQAMLRSLEASVDLARHQLVLIDDASSDGTSDFLDSLENRPEITILRNSENLGFAASNNKAAAAARHPILVFINNDLEFSEGWLAPMLEALSHAPQAGAVGNVQRNFATGLVDHAGIFFDLDGLPTHAHKNRRQPPRGKLLERNAVTAACLAIRAETFRSVGGFDESYRNGCEDVDLCMKLKKAGYRLYVALDSVIRHHISISPGRNRHNDRNTETFRRRWSSYSRQLGEKEWPREYFRRYARYWWRMNPKLAAKALLMRAGLRH
ncbi:glycosyltransferase family 2 protein [Pelagicoccus sp. NFK12]|uniref:Glycosyltransferase family 2 protein n=1 Tax=Pelagicoccus enzymogenes TaxID=2773457 RepID=A0A927F6A3_9BACT|nr:glycosyltransferase family 2 protein [Pelagicoccus enzymogenes]MBD5779237.1 glycosyltransferase family 2 protein [Pelagicoccus enzymogenes]MDQ8198410.1 glycosyltransferase family 2 protein [Pelagicoccus enzymogenes]